MKVRTRFMLLMVMATLFYAAILLTGVSVVTSNQMQRMEHELAEADLLRGIRALEAATKSLKNQVRDYARWDSAWQYVNDQDPAFLEKQLSDSLLRNWGIGLIAIRGSDSKIRLAHFTGTRDSPSLPESAFWSESSYLTLGEKLFLVSAMPITRSDGSGGSQAMLLLGRQMDYVFVAGISSVLGSPFQLFLPQHPNWASVNAKMGPSNQVVVADNPVALLEGYYRQNNPQGNPLFVLKTTSLRPLTPQLLGFNLQIGSVTLLVGLLLVVLVWSVFSLTITRPLMKLASYLDRYDFREPGRSLSRQLEGLNRSQDEIGTISRVVGDLADRLSANNEALFQSNTNLEEVVAERTQDLVLANQHLTQYSQILADTSEGMLVTDLEHTILEVNAAFCRLTGFSSDELVGQAVHLLRSSRQSPDFFHELESTLAAQGRWSGEIWNRRKDGEIVPFWLSISTLNDEEGRLVRYVGLYSDISRIKQAEQRLNQLAYFDSLTGLPNRAMFLDRLGHALARAQRVGSKVALLFLDLDRFKLVNDTRGHGAGDELLVQVSQRLVKTVRNMDTVCRLGGDEFTLIIEDLARNDNVAEIARKIIEALTLPFFLEGKETYSGASVGIALAPEDGLDSTLLIQKADEAMYQAKRSGRGQFCFASGSISQETHRRMEIELGLRRALERQELVLHYQPQWKFPEGSGAGPGVIVGAEALLRWNREGSHLLGPAAFIDIAEESNLICQFGVWALRTACRFAQQLCQAGRPIIVSVNLSVRQFAEDDLVATVKTILDETGLDPRLLRLEITESVFMKDIERVIASMQAIRGLGVSFAVDDFGVGFSSLQYLSRLPLDCLKIDKSFIDGMEKAPEKVLLVQGVISLAQSFGLSSVAEGVETLAQLDMLRARGCDLIQGYYTGRPLPTEEFRTLVLGVPSGNP